MYYYKLKRQSVTTTYDPTSRTTPTRYRERASYDRDVVHRILDEALICLRERSSGKLVRAFWEIARNAVVA